MNSSFEIVQRLSRRDQPDFSVVGNSSSVSLLLYQILTASSSAIDPADNTTTMLPRHPAARSCARPSDVNTASRPPTVPEVVNAEAKRPFFCAGAISNREVAIWVEPPAQANCWRAQRPIIGYIEAEKSVFQRTAAIPNATTEVNSNA